MTLVASPPCLIAQGFGHKGAKTYALQQDGGDSDMRGGDEAVHSHDAHMACVNQAVTHAITTQCCMHIHCVQVACIVWTCKVTLVASRPPLIAWGFGHKMCARLTYCSKTAETTTCVVEARPYIHAARTWRGSLKLSHMPSPRSAACTRAACRSRAVFGLLRGDLGGISSTSHSVGLWSQDVRKTYVLQQDGRDNDVRGGGEAVHSRDAHMARGSLKLSHVPLRVVTDRPKVTDSNASI